MLYARQSENHDKSEEYECCFVTGWMIFLSYYLVCPFEALAAGRITGYLFPPLNSFELYRLGGRPVYLPHVILALAITVLFTWLNYRGIQASARFLKWTPSGKNMAV